MRSLFLYIFILVSLRLVVADSTDFNFEKLEPEPQHKKVSSLLVKYLTNFHYQKRAVDDSLSSELYNRYFEKLDPSRVYFLESDIAKFEDIRYKWDDYLTFGYVDPAYEIFSLYEQRITERLTYVYNRLEVPFDFKRDEYLEIDHSEAPWAKTTQDLDEIWRKRLKNEALNLKLSGKEWDEIVSTLIKRYKRVQKNVSQFQSEDVFQLLMNSLAESFDPHTTYFSPKIYDDFKIQMSQAYSGIGARLGSEDDFTVVKEIIPGGPADKAGSLHEDDKISGVGQDDEGEIVDVVGWRIDDVVQLIRGEKATKVRLQIQPAGSTPGAQPDTVALIRDKIKLEDHSAEGRIIEVTQADKVFHYGVIDIPQFYSDFEGRNAGEKDFKGTTNDVRKIIHGWNTDTLDGVIIDLRRNGGGFLNEAIELTGLFIEKGPVVQVRNSSGRVTVEWDDNNEIAYKGPLAVVVDRISASASEIFAAAIQDYKRGLVIGSQTYGKGTVQNAVGLNRFLPHTPEKLGQLKITIAKFYRINGGSTQHVGVIPDISLPSRFELMDIGESTEKNALLWDQIDPVKYDNYSNIDSFVPKLAVRHNLRVSKDVQFAELLESMDEFEKNKNKKVLSLNESERKQERETAEEEKRIAKEKEKDQEDLPILESARILSDYILLSDS
ncbi:MAG: tail-specific protease [Calditrichales bacterium]|nr:MAG: tail-specific protease [Calditrichales bacterium]